MISYQKIVEYIYSNQEDEPLKEEMQTLLPSRLLNPFVFDKIVTAEGISKPHDNSPLRSYDRDLQLDLAYLINQIKSSVFIIETSLKLLNEKKQKTVLFF